MPDLDSLAHVTLGSLLRQPQKTTHHMDWDFPFDFSNESEPDVKGVLTLSTPIPYVAREMAGYASRQGMVRLESGRSIPVVLYHNPHAEAFFYLSDVQLTRQLYQLLGLDDSVSEDVGQQPVQLPGQFILGSKRRRLVHKATAGLFGTQFWQELIGRAEIDEVVVFPIVREGVKFGIVDAIADRFNWIVEEVLVDAHHVYDSQIPGYARRTKIAVFKDNDLNEEQRSTMHTAIVGDSIASGTVLISVVEALNSRYENLKQIEVVAPFAALRGLARMAGHVPIGVTVRVHAFESLLNALAPDYYWSAHYPQPEFHFEPALEASYRNWWGKDEAGNWLADTACAGYGWSEAFFNPRKHLRMISDQLRERHGMSIRQLIQDKVLTST